MKQQKKAKVRRDSQKESFIPLSIIIPDYADNKTLSLFLESIKKIKKPF